MPIETEISNSCITVAAFTGGKAVPSARFRVRQYIGRLRSLGVDVTEFEAILGSYPPKPRILRPLWGTATLAARVPGILKSYHYDVTLLQREMLSTFVTLEPFTKRPAVLDVDDAIWLHRNGAFAEKLARGCAAVICGNNFLAEKFSCWNKNVIVLPTAVDTNRFTPIEPNSAQVIGWSGTSGGFKYLYSIESALHSVLKSLPRSRLRIVSDSTPSFSKIPSDKIEFIRWTPENEVKAVQGMSVGIMPLEDSLWARGKCSFKMLTYMACGVPVVVSPIGMNVEVLSQGEVGIGASSPEEWFSALLYILSNPEKGAEMGEKGRETVLKSYSLETVARQLSTTLHKIAQG